MDYQRDGQLQSSFPFRSIVRLSSSLMCLADRSQLVLQDICHSSPAYSLSAPQGNRVGCLADRSHLSGPLLAPRGNTRNTRNSRSTRNRRRCSSKGGGFARHQRAVRSARAAARRRGRRAKPAGPSLKPAHPSALSTALSTGAREAPLRDSDGVDVGRRRDPGVRAVCLTAGRVVSHAATLRVRARRAAAPIRRRLCGASNPCTLHISFGVRRAAAPVRRRAPYRRRLGQFRRRLG